MDREQILAFRLARSGLARRDAPSVAAAASPPASDFAQDAALQALAARRPSLTREDFEKAVEAGDEIVVAYVIRGAIHALPREQFALLGRALLADDDEELGRQLGRQVQRLAAEHGFAPTVALAEVAEATAQALADGRALGKNDLHEELRARVDPKLMPWCKGCQSYHVAPMLWRYAAIQAGARLDSERRYLLDDPPGRPKAADAVRSFLAAYAPAEASQFAEWAGLAPAHAQRLWGEVEDELVEVNAGRRKAWALAADAEELESPPGAKGVVLLPPGDPYLQKTSRPLLAPDDELRKRLFRPVASPGAVLCDGKLAGLWKTRAKGRRLEISVETLSRVPQAGLQAEADRVAALRGAREAVLVID